MVDGDVVASGVEPPTDKLSGAYKHETMTCAELLSNFISFGDNAEFGIIQSFYGAEVSGLLAFGGSDCQIDGLIDALEGRFEKLFVHGAIGVIRSDDNWVVACHPYGWSFFSAIPVSTPQNDVILTERNSITKSVLNTIKELTYGTKIFLIKHNSAFDMERYRRLVSAVRLYSNKTVLCVVPSDSTHHHGMVEVIEPGFLIGYHGALAPYTHGHLGVRYAWIDLCSAAFASARLGHNIPTSEHFDNRLTPLPARELLSHFVSFGDNCEFGLVQRKVGLEVLDLLRFGGIGAGRLYPLMKALIEKFEGFRDPSKSVVVRGGDEWIYATYGMSFHTARSTDVPLDKVIKEEKLKMKFLANKTIEDLEAGNKIFVIKTNILKDLLSYDVLFRLIRSYGQCGLLHVTQCDPEHPSGMVEVLEDGFYRGYVERFAPYENANDFLVDPWVDLCRNVHAIWAQRSPVTEPVSGS